MRLRAPTDVTALEVEGRVSYAVPASGLVDVAAEDVAVALRHGFVPALDEDVPPAPTPAADSDTTSSTPRRRK